jgi:acetyltransferase
MYLYHYQRHLEQLYETPEELNIKTPAHKETIKKILDAAEKEKRDLLNEMESKTFLELYGIKTTKPHVAETEDKAAQLAEKIGYPVVMKIHSPQITHKSDVGGVVLDLRCKEDVKKTFKEMVKRAKEKAPDAKILGVTIQKMIKTRGYELIMGSKKDPVFGSVILYGLGGIYTELFKGFRGLPPVNMTKVEETLVNFSQLIIDYPEIKEIDINPLIASGDELIAVDARIILDKNWKDKPHLIIMPYPTKYVKTVKLKDGTEVLFRPIKPEDELLWLDMFQTFSQETVRFRFFRILKDTPHEMRTRYCNIDYDREIAIVAEVKEKDKRRFLGVTRVILKPGNTDEAEYALVVTDKWQRLGLGSEFIDYTIEIAKDKGVKKLYGVVLKDNVPMLTLCREKNFKITEGDPGEYEVEYDLAKQ